MSKKLREQLRTMIDLEDVTAETMVIDFAKNVSSDEFLSDVESRCRKVLSQYLKEWEKTPGNSVSSFAEKVGLKYQSIKRFLNKETSMTLKNISKALKYIQKNPI